MHRQALFVCMLATLLVGGYLVARQMPWIPRGPSASPSVPPSTATDQPTPHDPTRPITMTPAPSPTPVGPSNTLFGWYYHAPVPTGQGLPIAVPSDRAPVLDRWGSLWRLPEEYARMDGAPRISLTFDEGYEHEDHTPRILDTLQEKGVPAAFFLSGQFIDENPALVLRMHAEGHQIGNHTWDHLSLPKLDAAEGDDAVLQQVRLVEDRFRELCGTSMLPILRPPMGEFSDRVLGLLKENGYTAVLWSFAYHDWETASQPDPEAAMERILGELHDGSILLLHAVSSTNVEILPDLVDAIRDRGYRIVPLPNP